MVPVILVNGWMTSSMEMGMRLGLMVQAIEEPILMVKSMEMELSHGQMALHTLARSLTTTFKDTEFTTGKMVVNLKVIG